MHGDRRQASSAVLEAHRVPGNHLRGQQNGWGLSSDPDASYRLALCAGDRDRDPVKAI